MSKTEMPLALFSEPGCDKGILGVLLGGAVKRIPA